MKILHLETGMNLYGGALQVLYLLRGLADRPEMENVLVCPEGSAISAKAAPAVSRLITVPMKGDLDLRFLSSLVGILKREQPDIVHLHSRRGADVLGGIAARLTGRTCVLTRRVDNPEPALLVRLKYRMYDRIITISEGIRDVLVGEGVPAGKIRCVPSAVDARIYSRPCDKHWFRTQFGLDEGERVCGVVAQFIERKGHRYLLRAVPEILAAVPAVRLLLFGKGPLEGELRSLCRELGIQDRVIFA
ncbi:MAG: glycosyltransferase, partial [bacterium]